MTYNGKEIKNGYTLESVNEIPALFAEIIANLGENEHLVDCNVKLGYDGENDKEIIRVICTTFVGDMPKPKRC